MGYRYKTIKVTKDEQVVVEATCDNCGAFLKYVFADMVVDAETGLPCWGGEQAENALEIRLEGGYGQYFDGIADALFCKDCVDKLLGAFPSLGVLMKESRL